VRIPLAERLDLVVDASVAGRWYVRSQPFLDAADRVQDDHNAGRISLIAPDNLLHEVAGVIHRAVFARRLSGRQGIEQLERFLDLALTLVETNSLVMSAFELSLRFGCSYYDAIYLEIARRHNAPFIHADGNLRRALSGRFPLEVWIEDFR